MENGNTKNRLTWNAIFYFIYVFLFITSIVLCLNHIFCSNPSSGLPIASGCGIFLSACFTYNRIRQGKGNNPIVNLKRDKYFAFAELSFFFAILLLAIIHLVDVTGGYNISELILALFFGLLGGSISVLYLIRR